LLSLTHTEPEREHESNFAAAGGKAHITKNLLRTAGGSEESRKDRYDTMQYDIPVYDNLTGKTINSEE